MNSPLSSLRLDQPVLAAPMAGGPSTPALAIAAAFLLASASVLCIIIVSFLRPKDPS